MFGVAIFLSLASSQDFIYSEFDGASELREAIEEVSKCSVFSVELFANDLHYSLPWPIFDIHQFAQTI